MDGTDGCGSALLPAGPLGAWLDQTLEVLAGDGEADVACGPCSACCTAGQFVHIAPDEADTLAHVPAALRFPAPGLPPGHVLMGFDEQGRCPMLVDDACSIYAHRPRTCRTYDCRVLAAAGVDVAVDDPAKAAIGHRVRRWAFDTSAPGDQPRGRAVRAAERFLARHAADLPDGATFDRPTPRAVAAVAVHDLFLAVDGDDLAAHGPSLDEVAAALRTRRAGAPGPPDH